MRVSPQSDYFTAMAATHTWTDGERVILLLLCNVCERCRHRERGVLNGKLNWDVVAAEFENYASTRLTADKLKAQTMSSRALAIKRELSENEWNLLKGLEFEQLLAEAMQGGIQAVKMMVPAVGAQ
mmetsp:Transcript_29730/g.60392  ORF Transcript_29730/g.60392 Transcript_29730/m.60392 type:complete len:126 (+) Transcript_29730:17-394(+)